MKIQKSFLQHFANTYCGNNTTSKPRRLTEICSNRKEYIREQRATKILSANPADKLSKN